MTAERISRGIARLLAAVILLAAGCKHGMHACVDTHIHPHFPTPGSSGPVLEHTLPSCQTDQCGPSVALLDVDGILVNNNITGPMAAGENPVSIFRERLEAIACDDCVQSVVVRINTHGGGVTASDIMRRDLLEFKRRKGVPVVVCLMDVAAGGGYYLATAGDQIVAHPTSITGGIGVILNTYNLEDAMAQFNIQTQFIKAGERIDIGSQAKKISDENKALLQTMANEFHARFKEVVLESRGGVNAADATNFDGRVFTATQARQRGLVDTIGYLDDAVETARQLAGTPSARVVMYHRACDSPRSPYYQTPNYPLQASLLPLSMPGLERTKLPTFLYMWEVDPTAERLSGR